MMGWTLSFSSGMDRALQGKRHSCVCAVCVGLVCVVVTQTSSVWRPWNVCTFSYMLIWHCSHHNCCGSVLIWWGVLNVSHSGGTTDQMFSYWPLLVRLSSDAAIWRWPKLKCHLLLLGHLSWEGLWRVQRLRSGPTWPCGLGQMAGSDSWTFAN